MKRTIIVIVAMLTLTACGGSGSTDAGTTTAASTPAAATDPPTPTATPTPTESPSEPEARTIASAEDVVAATGCTGYELADEAAPFTSTYGTCTWKGARLQVYTFDNSADLAKFWDMVSAYGVTPKQAAVVGLVVAAPKSQKNLAELRQLLGA